MSQEPGGDAYTLGLLVDLRDICRRIASEHASLSHELHVVMQSIANPNLYDIPGLFFTIEQWRSQPPERLRIIAAANSLAMAQVAFERTVELYPSDQWWLCNRAQILRKHPPEPAPGA